MNINSIQHILPNIHEYDWNFQDSNKSESIHSIHPYPAKFIPEIPRQLLNILDIPNSTAILDPFCGSGVTLVESQNHGFSSYGIDLNPIACLISRVKTSPLPDNIKNISNEIINNSKQLKNISIPSIPNLDHWFKKDIQLALSSLCHEINNIKNKTIEDALKFALSSIIVKVSNQDSDTRYAAVEKSYNADDVYTLFKGAIDKLYKYKNNNGLSIQKSIVLNKNIFDVSENDFSDPIGAIITSPPYPNAYEYWLYHKYRMYWLGFNPIDVKSLEIGARAHYFKKNHQTVNDFKNQLNNIFLLFNRIVIKHGYIVFVMGRSKIHGNIIMNEQLIIDAAKVNNFKLVDLISRKINLSRKSFNLSHSRMKDEFVIILQR